VILFEPASRLLVSADALWERGFGVVFPELEGVGAFDAVGATIDLIEALKPAVAIPGHGPIFSDVEAAIAFARERLRGFVAKPEKHIKHAVKVLLKFKLLELQSIAVDALLAWAQATPYFLAIYQQHFSTLDFAQWVDELIADLVRAGVASRDGVMVRNVG
jgi:glyoxylase-like metal-dependent hydrolase (beta-lactamase superfamily II)